MIYLYIILYFMVGFFFAELVDMDEAFLLVFTWPVLFIVGLFIVGIIAIGGPGVYLAQCLKRKGKKS